MAVRFRLPAPRTAFWAVFCVVAIDKNKLVCYNEGIGWEFCDQCTFIFEKEDTEMSRRPEDEARVTVEELQKKLNERSEELSIAHAKVTQLEEELKAARAKRPEADPEVAKKLKTLTDENATQKRQIREKDDLLAKAKATLEKAGDDLAKAKAEAELAEERAAEAEKAAAAAEARAAEAEQRAKEAEERASAAEAEPKKAVEAKPAEVRASEKKPMGPEVKTDFMTTAERDEYIATLDKWIQEDKARETSRTEYVGAKVETTNARAAYAAKRNWAY